MSWLLFQYLFHLFSVELHKALYKLNFRGLFCDFLPERSEDPVAPNMEQSTAARNIDPLIQGGGSTWNSEAECARNLDNQQNEY